MISLPRGRARARTRVRFSELLSSQLRSITVTEYYSITLAITCLSNKKEYRDAAFGEVLPSTNGQH